MLSVTLLAVAYMTVIIIPRIESHCDNASTASSCGGEKVACSFGSFDGCAPALHSHVHPSPLLSSPHRVFCLVVRQPSSSTIGVIYGLTGLLFLFALFTLRKVYRRWHLASSVPRL